HEETATICPNEGNRPPAKTPTGTHRTTSNQIHRPTESSLSPPSAPSTSIPTEPDHIHRTARSGITSSRLRVLSPQPPSGHAHL
ncbi:Hypothetical predicted protein, partial [Pelobates cultripes]